LCPKTKKQVDSLFQATHTSDDISVDVEDKRPPRSGNCGFIMRRLSTWHIAAFGTSIVTLFIVGACSQQPSSTPAVEPVATPTSAAGDAEDEPGNQVAGQTSQDQSTQEEGQTTDTTPTAEPVATPTSAPDDAGDEPGNQVAGQTSQDQSTQEEGQTTDTSDSTP